MLEGRVATKQVRSVFYEFLRWNFLSKVWEGIGSWMINTLLRTVILTLKFFVGREGDGPNRVKSHC